MHDFVFRLQIAVAKGGYELHAQVLSDVRWWEATVTFPGRLLWHCSSQVFLLGPFDKLRNRFERVVILKE
jgi:hypothetical protein